MKSKPDAKNVNATLFSRFSNLVGKNKKIVLIGIVLLVGGFIAWSLFHRANNQTNLPSQTAQVERGTLVVSVNSAGQISADNSRTVTTNVSGVVKKVFVENAQTVKSGDKIAELELDQESQQAYTQAVASYQSAKNSLASAQANLYSLQAAMLGKWDTFKELSENDTYKDTSSTTRSLPEFHIPQKEWLAAEAQYKNQQSVVAQAQTALSSSSQTLKLASPIIYAPISGNISGLSLTTGTVLSTQSGASETSTSKTIAHISTNALPTVTVNLTEVDVTKVKLNNKVTITVDALPDKTYTGKVISIDTIGSVSSGVTFYPAVVTFDTQAAQVFSNMSAQASIIIEVKDNVMLIPTSAVQTQNGVSSVKVMKDGKEVLTPVVLGISSGMQIEIVSGLNPGDTIVTSTVQAAPGTSNQTSPFSGSGFGGGGFGGSGAIRMPR